MGRWHCARRRVRECSCLVPMGGGDVPHTSWQWVHCPWTGHSGHPVTNHPHPQHCHSSQRIPAPTLHLWWVPHRSGGLMSLSTTPGGLPLPAGHLQPDAFSPEVASRPPPAVCALLAELCSDRKKHNYSPQLEGNREHLQPAFLFNTRLECLSQGLQSRLGCGRRSRRALSLRPASLWRDREGPRRHGANSGCRFVVREQRGCCVFQGSVGHPLGGDAAGRRCQRLLPSLHSAGR